ncbi:MAG: glycosyltransferase family 4 protein [Patescibacteria group bacterium]|jgi:glycosyltransferase involved in cell wall biosynthesis
MKIAFIGQKGMPAKGGGVEKHVEELSIRLVKRGHEAIVYTRTNYTERKLGAYKGVKLVSLPNIKTKSLDAITHTFMACLDVIFRKDIDIVHFHSIGPSSLIWLIKIFKPGTPIVATFHSQCYLHKKWGLFARLYLKFGEYSCCKFADKVIAISESLKKRTAEEYNVLSEYIPNAVMMRKKKLPKIIKAKWGLDKDGYILSVSRLVPVKGIHYIIGAYNELKTNKKLVIAGDGAFNGEYIGELERKSGGNEKIIFTGNLSGRELDELYSNACLFVQASEVEGLSIALLEAMSFDLPVLVSDIRGNLDALGGRGLTFINKNTDDLKEKIKFALANPKVIHKLAKEAKKRVVKHYDWEENIEDVISVYHEAMSLKQKSFFNSFFVFKAIKKVAFRWK